MFQKDQGAVIMPFITQPQRPQWVTSAIVTGPHIVKGRGQRPRLSMEEYQHHICRRGGMKYIDVAIFEKYTCHKVQNRQTNLQS